MSKVRASSIKGLGVASNGPFIDLDKFSHGQPLDMGGSNITTGVLTISTVNITTCTSTTLNATNLTATNNGQINLNGDELLIPTGTTAERPTTNLFGNMRVNSELGQVEMYTNQGGTGAGWEKLG